MLEAQQYEDANSTERTEEHSGVGPFAEQALVTKKAALQKVFLDTEEERQKHTVAAGPAAMQPSQLLQTLQKAVPGLKLAMGGEASGSDPAAPAVAPSGAAEVEEQEEEEAEEEEEICPAVRYPRLIGKKCFRPLMPLAFLQYYGHGRCPGRMLGARPWKVPCEKRGFVDCWHQLQGHVSGQFWHCQTRAGAQLDRISGRQCPNFSRSDAIRGETPSFDDFLRERGCDGRYES